MRISKNNARIIAFRMTDKKATDVENLEKEISKMAHELVESKIPAIIMAGFEKNKGYYNKCGRLQVYGEGLNGETFEFAPALPNDMSKSDNGSWCTTLNLEGKVADKFRKLHDKYNEEQKALDKLREDIEIALMTLGSYKRIIAEFPDAEQFLPKRETQDLTVNIPSIIKRIKQQ